jgi:hypothetical protein
LAIFIFMKKQNEVARIILRQLSKRQIAYHPAYKKITKSTVASILLSQLMYWWEKMDGREFYKTDAEIEEETAMSNEEIRTAKAKLRKLDFVNIELKGVPCRTFYSIDLDGLIDALSQTELGESPQPVCGNAPSQLGAMPPTNTIDYTTNYSRESDTYELTPSNWIVVANLMAEYVKNEGAAQWKFMCQVTNYKGDPLPLFSNWAGKASPYELSRWKEMIPKLQNWMKNEVKSNPTMNIKKSGKSWGAI